ncbi:hypothetical protein QYF36_006537 [Acer negundo]|nr:hypothetical protein QYF36_006537 [Acer negundo]
MYVDENMLREQMSELVLSCNNNSMTRNEVFIHRLGKEPYKSKNLFAERRRRNNLRDKLYTLHILVPKISKELRKLNEELKEIEEEECKENAKLKSSKLEVLVEVNKIGERDFLI